MAKLQAYESRRDRIEPRVRQLQEHIYLALRISNNLHPVHHSHLTTYFSASLDVMRRALQWAQGVEESLFLLLDNGPTAAKSQEPPSSPPPLPRVASPPLRSTTTLSMPVSEQGFVPAPVPPSVPAAATALPTALAISGPSSLSPSLTPAQPHRPFIGSPFAPLAASSLYPADVAPRMSAPAQLPYLASVPPPSLARDNGDLPARVKTYEEEGENLLVRAMEEGDAAVQGAADSLRERLHKEIQACSAVPGLEEFAQRCAATRSYLDDNLALMKRLRTGQGIDEVERFDTELFRLLHLSSGISPANITESTALRNGLLKLMKDLVVYKGVMLKREAPEAAPVLRRLEDLQENVANFEAEVTLKFGWERGFADRAKEMLKSKQIAEAKREHENITDNIYEL